MKTRVVALGVALALLTAACGSRLSDEELSAGGGTGGPQPNGQTPGGTAPTGPAEGMIGDLEIPCSEGEAPPAEPTGDEVGVSADAIEIAVISDKAGQVKVPTASIEESMQAFVDWCNGFGGINGRELQLTKIDSKLFSHLEATREACDAGVFAIVGSGSVTDNQGAQQMVDCGLVEVPAYTATAAKALSDRMVQPLPNPSNFFPTGPAIWMKGQHPEAVTKAAILYSNIETAVVQAERIQQAHETQGFEFVYTKSTQVVQESYATEAQEMKEAGVEWVSMVSATSETAKLLRDMRTQGFEPEVIDLGQQYYDPELLAEPGAEGAYVLVNTVPFEEAEASPALQTYLEAYESVGADVDPTSLGVQAFSAGLLFATAAKALGDDLTRENLLTELQGITEWTGGGLHFPTSPGTNAGSTCFAYMRVVDGAFVREHPAEPATYDCDDSYTVDLEDDFGGGAKAG